MKREIFKNLTKEGLIEIILKLHQENEKLHQENEKLHQENEKLHQENERLKQRIEELEKKILKTSHNSSLPPSRDYKANTKQSNPKKKGPPYGHIGKSRLRVENPDIVSHIQIEKCKTCGKDLSNMKQRIVGKSQITEIPKVEPVIIETCIYETKCPYCGEINHTEYPEGYQPHQVFGSQIEAYVNYFVHRQHLSRERVEKMMEEIFGLVISQGAIDNIIRQGAEKGKILADIIREMVSNAPVKGSDETGCRVGGKNWWEWVWQTPEWSYHEIIPSRSGKVNEEVMGKNQEEVRICDLYGGQLKANAEKFQADHCHLIRDLNYSIERGDEKFSPKMKELLLESQQTSKDREKMEQSLYQQKVKEIETTFEELLNIEVESDEGKRQLKRFKKHRDKIFTFLHDFRVPYHNNDSERDVRNSVIHRKVIGGFRSAWGAKAYSVFTSISQTALRKGIKVIDMLKLIAGRSFHIELYPILTSSP